METSRTCNGPHTWSRITTCATCLCLLLLSSYSASAAPLRAPAASPTSITLTWTAPGDDTTSGAASQYDLRYSLAPINEANWGSATPVDGEPVPAVSGSLESFTVTGLTPSTTYYFAIKAADEIPNWSALSNVVSAATDAEATAPATVADLAGSNITPTTLNLTWTAPGDDGSSGTAATYDIRYASSLTVLQNWTTATQLTNEPAPAIAGTQQSYTVTGLNPSTTYYFALRTADEVPNWSASSNTVTATTLPEQTAPGSVANLVASSPTTSAVTLTWTAPGDDGNTGTAAVYDIRYSTALITAANFASAQQVAGEPSPRAAGGSESFTVTGLAAGTTYYFALKTADEVPNWSGLSNVPSATTISLTESNPPATVANLTVINPTRSSLTLLWTAPGDDGATGTAATYDIRYSTVPISGGVTWNNAIQIGNEPAPSPAGTPETLTVNGLNEGTTYYFALRTADEIPNWSGISNVPFGTTALDQTPPSAIGDLQASTGTDKGTIVLGWTAPGDDGASGRATVYEIRYALDSVTSINWAQATLWPSPPAPVDAGQFQSVVLSGLMPGEVYYIGVKARDDANNISLLSNIDSAVAKYDLSLDVDDDELTPDGYILSQNYPNPFNPSTEIRVTMPRAADATLTVYNTAGQEVATLVDGPLSPGEHYVTWDGMDARGDAVATGVYYYRLVAGDRVETKKMMLLK